MNTDQQALKGSFDGSIQKINDLVDFLSRTSAQCNADGCADLKADIDATLASAQALQAAHVSVLQKDADLIAQIGSIS